MSESIGKVGIEISVDNGKLESGINDAKRTIKSFGSDLEGSIGTATKRASNSIDSYVRSLETIAATQGRSTRETELYKLALRGASAEQLGAANSALRLAEAYQQGEVIGTRLRAGFLAVAAAAAAAAAGVAAGTIALINQVGKYQDLADKIGDTAVNISSLKTASDVTGTSLDTIASASVRLTATLSKTDDESKSAGRAIKALGLDFETFKSQTPVEQLQSVARALETFADGSQKSAVAVALFGKTGADLLGFLKEYSTEGLKAAYVSDEQVAASDNLGDSIARLKSEFEQFLQVAAADTIPIITDIGSLFGSLANQQEAVSTASDLVKGSINALVTVFQTISVVGSDVVFVFQGVGREIGAIAAQLAALARLDFKAFSAISDAVKADAQQARAELDKFQAALFAIGQNKPDAGAPQLVGPPAPPNTRPRLDISGLNTDKPGAGARKAANTAAQEAKAQLALDLEDIRKAGDKLTTTISNNEKLVQAQRSASLLSDADYFAKKRANIEQINRAQIATAQQELERLQQEKLTGKDRIDNQRKINDAQAKIDQLRASGTVNLQILSVQEQAALTAIQRAYDDARIAAQSYFDQTEQGRQSELDGIGQGQRARDKAAAIQQIQDKYEQQRQELQRANRNGEFAGRQSDYDRELALINEFQGKSVESYLIYYQKLEKQRGNFDAGASEALKNYYDETQDTFSQTERLITNSFQGAEDALVDFVKTGKLSFSSLADSILTDLARIAVQKSITGPLSKFLFEGEGGGVFGAIGDFFGGGKAAGGPVEAGKLYQVNEQGPELLNVAGRQYLMMGNQGGSVTPNSASGSSKTINVVVNQSFASSTSRATVAQAAVDARRQLESAARNS